MEGILTCPYYDVGLQAKSNGLLTPRCFPSGWEEMPQEEC